MDTTIDHHDRAAPASDPVTAATQTIPRSGLALLERMLVRRLDGLRSGDLSLTFPSGRRITVHGSEPGPSAVVTINSMALLRRVLVSGDLGLAEAFVADEWRTPDLLNVLAFGVANEAALAGLCGPSRLMRWACRAFHARNANTRRGSRRNISAHYDLGNAFYEHWLDRTMTYSSALFEDPAEPLADAQERKYRRMAELIGLGAGDRILEIGCGWGGFAEYAARTYGCTILCLTLSVEQAAYARQRMKDHGLEDRVEIRIQDYRDVEGTFDKIVSIEMFEAVGEAYWPTYLDALSRRLKRGGKAALQIITIDDAYFEQYRRTPDFIQRHVFPGGMLPGPAAFERATAAAGLTIADRFFFGASYAETLRRWNEAFERNWQHIRDIGFDDAFFRLWHYYLRYCEVGFESGRTDVGHFVLQHR